MKRFHVDNYWDGRLKPRYPVVPTRFDRKRGLSQLLRQRKEKQKKDVAAVDSYLENTSMHGLKYASSNAPSKLHRYNKKSNLLVYHI